MKKLLIIVAMCLVLTACSTNTYDVEKPNEDNTGDRIITISPEEQQQKQNEIKVITLDDIKNLVDENTKSSKDFNNEDAGIQEVNRGISYSASGDEWKGLIIYLFDDVDKAKFAFNYVESSMVKALFLEKTDNEINGYDNTAENISIKKYYYRVNNIIIEKTDFIGDPGIVDAVESDYSKEENAKIHQKIKEFWTVENLTASTNGSVSQGE